jgi:hypothetical protein
MRGKMYLLWQFGGSTSSSIFCLNSARNLRMIVGNTKVLTAPEVEAQETPGTSSANPFTPFASAAGVLEVQTKKQPHRPGAEATPW